MDELRWITQFSQLTASAVVSAVLGYLLYLMPRHFAAERKSREVVAGAYARSIDAVIAENRETTKYEREMCERHFRELVDSQNRRHREAMDLHEQRNRDLLSRVEASHLLLREGVHTMNNLAHAEALRRAAEEAKLRGRGRYRGEPATTDSYEPAPNPPSSSPKEPKV